MTRRRDDTTKSPEFDSVAAEVEEHLRFIAESEIAPEVEAARRWFVDGMSGGAPRRKDAQNLTSSVLQERARQVLTLFDNTREVIATGDADAAAAAALATGAIWVSSQQDVVLGVNLAKHVQRGLATSEGIAKTRDVRAARQRRLLDVTEALDVDSDWAAAHALMKEHRFDLAEWEHTPRILEDPTDPQSARIIPDLNDDGEIKRASASLYRAIRRARDAIAR